MTRTVKVRQPLADVQETIVITQGQHAQRAWTEGRLGSNTLAVHP